MNVVVKLSWRLFFNHKSVKSLPHYYYYFFFVEIKRRRRPVRVKPTKQFSFVYYGLFSHGGKKAFGLLMCKGNVIVVCLFTINMPNVKPWRSTQDSQDSDMFVPSLLQKKSIDGIRQNVSFVPVLLPVRLHNKMHQISKSPRTVIIIRYQFKSSGKCCRPVYGQNMDTCMSCIALESNIKIKWKKISLSR